MKQYITKFLFGLAAALLVAVPVQAQTYSKVKNDSSGNFVHREATVINSGTTIAYDNVPDTSASHNIVVTSGTGNVTATIKYALGDGSIVSTSNYVFTPSPTVITRTAPLNYQKFAVSPSAIATDTLTVDSVSTK